MEFNFDTFKNTSNLEFPKTKIKTEEVQKQQKQEKNSQENSKERRKSENPFDHDGIGVFSKVKKEQNLF